MFLGLRSRPAPASQGLKIPGGLPTPAPCTGTPVLAKSPQTSAAVGSHLVEHGYHGNSWVVQLWVPVPPDLSLSIPVPSPAQPSSESCQGSRIALGSSSPIL